MKKIYIIPNLTIVSVNLKHHLMDLSQQGSASISSFEADGNAFVKDNSGSRSDYNVWDDDWSKN